MKAVSWSSRALATGMTLGLLTACGGGGGGGGGGIDLSKVSFPAIPITESNAVNVAAAVVNSFGAVEGSTGGSDFLFGVVGGATGTDFRFIDFARRQLAHAKDVAGLNVLPGANLGTIECDPDGFIKASGQIEDVNPGDGLSLTVGDNMQLDFVNCTDDTGDVINGGFDLEVLEGLDPDPFDVFPEPVDPASDHTLVLGSDMRNLSVDNGFVTVIAHGDMDLYEDIDNTIDTITLAMSGNSLASTDGIETVKLTGFDYPDYRYRMEETLAGNYELVSNATLGSTQIDGEVSFRTITPFTGNSQAPISEPSAGELLIISDLNNSKAWVIAHGDGINVEIRVDANGDDTYDDGGEHDPPYIFTTWEALRSL